MVTISQIKAARSLLNWRQSDLARISGISLPAIANIELGKGNPRQHTLHALQGAFEKHGVEFLGNHGVDLRQERFSINVYNGTQGITQIWQDIVNTFNDGKGGEVLLNNLDERVWIKMYGERLKTALVERQKLHIVTRALVKEGENLFLMPTEWHRAVPAWLFAQTPYYVYANKLAILNFKDSPRFILMESQSVADTFRRQFEYNWRQAKKIKSVA